MLSSGETILTFIVQRESRGYAHAIPGANHATLHNGVNIQVARDLG